MDPVPEGQRPAVRVPDGAETHEHELATARRLAAAGFTVAFNVVDRSPGAKNPDVTIDGVVWDGKDPAKYADSFKVKA